MRDWLTDRAFRTFIGAARLLPYRWRVPLMGWIMRTIVAPLAGHKARIRDNLAHACPELSEAEVRRLCKSVPDNVGRTLIEIYSGQDFVARAQKAKITGPGLEALEQARADGRPVILVTGHFGNYDAARAALIGRGHNMGALYRAMSNPWFNDHYVKAITAIGTPMFEQGKRGMIEMVRHIKAGGVLGILTDLHAAGGARTSYFDKPVKTSTVTAELALKFDAPLIPVYAIRQPDGLSFEIVLLDEIKRGDAVEMTQAVNDGLEALVRQHMNQWFWIHRRWKIKNPVWRQRKRAAATMGP
ncbi:lysophospholipid acyltransferase family protein [Thalassococcus lentus]|uniref:Lysophospholipid acyltransferase family protein n=1 Tax=Thalassococcus lentus TaxID=1210524 RepID=A0ABT4XRD5_9RHOB|nr:lysophospholipid acyltransferase family protein [Thalassococcus lentus]MDA7424521.1 lysophospholipid acyltransferase family protein [Thalassococcus lentus]